MSAVDRICGLWSAALLVRDDKEILCGIAPMSTIALVVGAMRPGDDELSDDGGLLTLAGWLVCEMLGAHRDEAWRHGSKCIHVSRHLCIYPYAWYLRTLMVVSMCVST